MVGKLREQMVEKCVEKNERKFQEKKSKNAHKILEKSKILRNFFEEK